MALIQDVAVIFARPQMAGWKQLLAQHGLDLTASDLAAELNRPLPRRSIAPCQASRT